MAYYLNLQEEVCNGDQYTVHEREHGWIVTGRITASSGGRLLSSFGEGAVIAYGVSSALQLSSSENVIFAIARDSEHHAEWCKKLDDLAAKEAKGDLAMEWMLGTDTGMSAVTIHSVMTDNIGKAQVHVPTDSDDFGRCHRLLEKIPEWRPRMPEVAEAFPQWRTLVERWDDLAKLYEAKQFKELDAALAQS